MARVNAWAVLLCTVLFLTVAIGSCAPRSPVQAGSCAPARAAGDGNGLRAARRYALFGDDVQADVLVDLTLSHVRSLVRPPRAPLPCQMLARPCCAKYFVTPPASQGAFAPLPCQTLPRPCPARRGPARCVSAGAARAGGLRRGRAAVCGRARQLPAQRRQHLPDADVAAAPGAVRPALPAAAGRRATLTLILTLSSSNARLASPAWLRQAQCECTPGLTRCAPRRLGLLRGDIRRAGGGPRSFAAHALRLGPAAACWRDRGRPHRLHLPRPAHPARGARSAGACRRAL